jgi:hypothetical protein
MELEEHRDALFHCQLLKIQPGKNKFCTDMIGLLGPKTTLNLC